MRPSRRDWPLACGRPPRQRDAAAQLEKLADAVVAGEPAEIERRLARFGGGLERIAVGHDVNQMLDIIRFLWPPTPESEP